MRNLHMFLKNLSGNNFGMTLFNLFIKFGILNLEKIIKVGKLCVFLEQ